MLGVTLCANGASWYVALREFRSKQGRRSFREALRKSKDPTVLTVLFEDSASLLGVVIALVGVLLSQLLETSIPDGVASILIGLVMGSVAVGLIMQCRTLIVGETATDELQAAVRTVVEGDGAVAGLADLKTLQLGPDSILVALRVRFRDGLENGTVGEAVERLERTIHEQRPECRSVFITPVKAQG